MSILTRLRHRLFIRNPKHKRPHATRLGFSRGEIGSASRKKDPKGTPGIYRAIGKTPDVPVEKPKKWGRRNIIRFGRGLAPLSLLLLLGCGDSVDMGKAVITGKYDSWAGHGVYVQLSDGSRVPIGGSVGEIGDTVRVWSAHDELGIQEYRTYP